MKIGSKKGPKRLIANSRSLFYLPFVVLLLHISR